MLHRGPRLQLQGPRVPAAASKQAAACALAGLLCTANHSGKLAGPVLWGTPSLLHHKLQSLLSHFFVYQ